MTLNVHSPLLPFASLAQYVTLVTPIWNRAPIGGLELNSTNRMLSLALGGSHVTPDANDSPGSVVVATLWGQFSTTGGSPSDHKQWVSNKVWIFNCVLLLIHLEGQSLKFPVCIIQFIEQVFSCHSWPLSIISKWICTNNYVQIN